MGKKPKPYREGNREEILESLVNQVCNRIRLLPLGTETSIYTIVRSIYSEQGYDCSHGWSRDGGKTYIIIDTDLFDVLEQVKDRLSQEYVLDFSAYKGLVVGLPYCTPFVLKTP